MGPREWLLLVVHSRPASVLGHPVVAAALFIVSLVAFYNSGLFESSLRGHTMHLFMVAHFLITGYFFANGVVGIDPGPKRPAYPLRVLIVMITFGFHSLFSVSLMSSSRVLAEDWFSSLGRTWGASLAEDQYLGASLGWALGDYPLGLLAGALVWSWARADGREAARHDRRAERDGHSELAAYNEHLKSLVERGSRRP
jgi:putative copper resistance protein D